MNVWNGLSQYPAGRAPVVATIGNYDGVHLGHRAILRSTVDDAHRRTAPALLISFDPHPLGVVAPERRPALLQTRRQKLACLEPTGITDLLIVEFDAALAALSGSEFFARLASAGVTPCAVHIGANFRFGRARAGDHELLARIGAARGFDVVEVPPVRVGAEIVSSSAVRAAVASGDVERAAALLGRPFSVEGTIIPGAGRGRELRFPTANLDPQNELLPGSGVYVTEAVHRGVRWPAVTNVGARPTFGAGRLVVETHLLDFEGQLYGEPLELCFLARLRDERTFADANELAAQIARDRDAAAAHSARARAGRT